VVAPRASSFTKLHLRNPIFWKNRISGRDEIKEIRFFGKAILVIANNWQTFED